jgi:hypothetical protein
MRRYKFFNRYDGVHEFDLQYECTCANGFTGANCDVAFVETSASAAASGGSADTTPFIAAVVAVVVLVLVLVLVVRFQRYKTEHRPADLSEMQNEIMSSLGIGSTLDIAPNEFGVTMTMTGLSDVHHVTASKVRDCSCALACGHCMFPV